jgi:hypothetical protein
MASQEVPLPSWREVVRHQGRSIRWLAIQTETPPATVYAYSRYARSDGKTGLPAHPRWLLKASAALGVAVGSR